MFTDILWRFLILEMFVLGTLCHVMWQIVHPQEQFCTSEFVLRVDIKKEIEWPNANAYLMKIKRFFKGDARRLNLSQNGFVILELPRNCTIYFLQTAYYKYVIFGESKNGNIYSQSCQGNVMWRLASPFYKHALETYYKDNCDCYKELPNFDLGIICYWRNSYMKKRGQNCNWAITSDLLTCQQRVG